MAGASSAEIITAPRESAASAEPSKKARSARLQFVLKLTNNDECYQRIRVKIMEIGRKHWDQDTVLMHQKDAKKAIEEELKETYPDIFLEEDGVKMLECAMSYLTSRHAKNLSKKRQNRTRMAQDKISKQVKKNSASSSFKRSNRRTGRSITKSNSIIHKLNSAAQYKYIDDPVPTAPSTDTPSAHPRTPLIERMASNLAFFASQPSNTRIFGTPKHNLPPPASPSLPQRGRPSLSSIPYVSDSCSLPVMIPTGCSFASSSSASFMSGRLFQATSTSCSNSSRDALEFSRGHQINSVYRFLKGCTPPMTHYLHRFIDAGCSTEEYLLGISLWPRERIERFLNGLPPAPDGTRMTRMDTLVLCNQFSTYTYFKA